MQTTVGAVQVTPLYDAPLTLMDPDTFFPSVADRMRNEFPEAIDARGLFSISITTYLVRSGGRTILVDSGLGGRRRARFPRGRLPEALAAAGVDPSEIDTVIHTHLHVDHVGWNTVEDDAGRTSLFFPRAEFVVNRPEWEYWMVPERIAEEGNAHLRECVVPVERAGRVRLVDGETALDAHVTVVPTPGHTPGHVAIGIHSGGERAVIIGDVSHHPLQLIHPDWSPSADVDPVLSGVTRERLFDEAIADGRTWFAGHWPFPGTGRLVRLEGKRTFLAG